MLNLFIIAALLEKMMYKSMTEKGAKGLASVPCSVTQELLEAFSF